MSLADPCCAPVDVAPAPIAPVVAVTPDPAPVVEAPAPIAPEPVHDLAPAPAPAHVADPAPVADSGGSPWAMSGPGVDAAPAAPDSGGSDWSMSGAGVDQPPAGGDAHPDLSFPGDSPWGMSGANVDATLSPAPDAAAQPAANGGDFTMHGADVDHALSPAPVPAHAEPSLPAGDALHFPGSVPLPGFDPSSSGAINDMGNGVAGLPTIFDIIGQTGDDNSRLILGNINGLDHSTGDSDHDGIPDFADSNDGSF